MGAVVGHWKDITEAQRLTQSQLLPGVIEEDIYRENLLDRMPVALAQGKSIKWNREKYVMDADVVDVDIGEKLTWTSSMEYDPQETELKRSAIQRLLDDFVVDVYGTVQNYEAQTLWEMKKGWKRRMGDKLIYDDITWGNAKQFNGFHALAAIQTGTDLDIDEGSALSLENFRKVIDAMKHGVDVIYLPPCIHRRINAAYQERAFAGTAGDHTMSQIAFGWNEAGKRMMFFDSIPLLSTDFLVKEKDGVGDGSDLRVKWAEGDGTVTYSIFFVKFGDIFANNPGICMGFGDPEMGSNLYKVELFDKLEDYDAKGIRLVTYVAPLLGSKLCLGRIFDVEDGAVTF